ncbi:hypothetical protein [Pelomonas cellulosilytica]|uniref:Uncharacterized protein n=1 Tax=Pelomonas cellulosilytica TaxID=2906762 RepID=A0ABS8Y0M1_9BURK|nr:hypothetical protein [Pelomonas sp. P8]MCE4556559.1 hypothetical protein [Pelomonas sp. P8]
MKRLASTATVRYVFELIWPEAHIDCHAGEASCRVDVWHRGLLHAVHVPWALVEVGGGVLLVRAVYRAGLPAVLRWAATGLSRSL